MRKTITIAGFAILSLFLVLSVVSAAKLTGSLGNSRMVLRAEPGVTVEKYLTVQNVNDVPVTIELIPAGDLAKNIVLAENNFSLEPKSEEKVYFTINADKAGTTESKINVKFNLDNRSGVGLSAVIIFIASGDAVDQGDDNPDTEDSNNTSSDSGNFISSATSNFSLSPAVILMISTIVLVILFIALLLYFLKTKRKKVVGRRFA